MENKYQLSTGILECYPLYAIFHFNASVYDHEEAEEFVEISIRIIGDENVLWSLIGKWQKE